MDNIEYLVNNDNWEMVYSILLQNFQIETAYLYLESCYRIHKDIFRKECIDIVNGKIDIYDKIYYKLKTRGWYETCFEFANIISSFTSRLALRVGKSTIAPQPSIFCSIFLLIFLINKAPIPFGPYILCPEIDNKSIFIFLTSIGIFPKGATFGEEIREAKKFWLFDHELIDSTTHPMSKIIIIYNVRKNNG